MALWLGSNLADFQEYWNSLNESGLWLWALGFAFVFAFVCMYFARPLSHWARAAGFVLLLALAAPFFVWLLGGGQQNVATVWLDNAPRPGVILQLPEGSVISDRDGKIYFEDGEFSPDTVTTESSLFDVADAGLSGRRGFVSLAWFPDSPRLDGASGNILTVAPGNVRLRFTFHNMNGDKIGLDRHALRLHGDGLEISPISEGAALGSAAEFALNGARPGRYALRLNYPLPRGEGLAEYVLEVEAPAVPVAETPPPPPGEKPAAPATISSATPMGQYLSPTSTTFKIKKNTFAVGQWLGQFPPDAPLTLSFRAYRDDPGSSLIIFFGNYRFDVGGSDGRSISRFVHDPDGQPIKDSGVYSKPVTFQLLDKRQLDVTLRYLPQHGEGYPSLTISLEQQGRQNNPPFDSRTGTYVFDFPRGAFPLDTPPRILLGASSIPAKDAPAESVLRITDIRLNSGSD